MKDRASIAIERDLKIAAESLARKRGVSLSRLVSETLEAIVGSASSAQRFPRSVTIRAGKNAAADHERLAFQEDRA